jgi:hypothetical protein
MNAVYPTARPANWPGRQYTNLLRIPQAEHPVVRRMEMRLSRAASSERKSTLLNAEICAGSCK